MRNVLHHDYGLAETFINNYPTKPIIYTCLAVKVSF